MIMQCSKVFKTYTELETELAENTKSSERQKTSFFRLEEIADFRKSALNKIITTQAIVEIKFRSSFMIYVRRLVNRFCLFDFIVL